MTEPEVAALLKRALEHRGLGGHRVRDILVDRDRSYENSPHAKMLEPMGNLRIGSRRPDMLALCDYGRYERVLAFEVKGSHDHEKGVVQAAYYRRGAHASYLCIPEPPKVTPDWLVDVARQQGVGLLAASSDNLRLVLAPASLIPEPESAEYTRRFLSGEREAQRVGSLGLNRPLHYAAATVAFAFETHPNGAWTEPERWGMGASALGHAVRGAAVFGLLETTVAREVHPTPIGLSLAETLVGLGFQLTPRSRRLTSQATRRLSEAAPPLASALRMVVLRHPLVDLIVRALLESGPTPVRDLVPVSARLDDALSAALFGGTPEDVEDPAWRPKPSTVFQLKRVLHDVGILDSPLARGASNLTTGVYDPDADVWELGAALHFTPPLRL